MPLTRGRISYILTHFQQDRGVSLLREVKLEKVRREFCSDPASYCVWTLLFQVKLQEQLSFSQVIHLKETECFHFSDFLQQQAVILWSSMSLENLSL